MLILLKIFFFLVVALHPSDGFSEFISLDEGVPIGMLERIFPLRAGNQFGSSFVIDVDNHQYLVTAKHVVSTIKVGDKVEIFRLGKWIPIKFAPIFPKNCQIDSVAIPLEENLARKLDFQLGAGGIYLGQKVYFLGFPFGLASRSKGGNDFIPFVKAGVLSAIDYGDGQTPILYVDGHNNPGFSGGPIIFGNVGQKHQLQIAAVVSGYRNQLTKVVEETVPDTSSAESAGDSNKQTTKKSQVVHENSGIVIGYQLEQLVEAIKESVSSTK